MVSVLLPRFSPERAILIAGPTASGKSGLALAIARAEGRRIVNADALQVYDGWNLLSARPSTADLEAADHVLYGHVSYRDAYSVGHWLRDLRSYLSERPAPVIVGGTGLYFLALTAGLADIPETATSVRQRATSRLAAEGIASLIAELDAATCERIDLQNPMRVQRAWEVQRQTGRGLADWQDGTGRPMLAAEDTDRILLVADKDWLNARIDRRFERMIRSGACEEAARMEPDWDPARLSSRAIGARELVAVVRGEMSQQDAIARATTATHQYAKRQRTWFRRRMQDWHAVDATLI